MHPSGGIVNQPVEEESGPPPAVLSTHWLMKRGRLGVHAPVAPAAYPRGMFPGGQPDMSQLLKQAQQMQQQLAAAQEQLAAAEVTGSAGGGLVTATMTGQGELTAVTISPDAVDADDLETLQDLVVAAVRDASRQVDELTASRMGPLAGGLGGGLGLPGL